MVPILRRQVGAEFIGAWLGEDPVEFHHLALRTPPSAQSGVDRRPSNFQLWDPFRIRIRLGVERQQRREIDIVDSERGQALLELGVPVEDLVGVIC